MLKYLTVITMLFPGTDGFLTFTHRKIPQELRIKKLQDKPLQKLNFEPLCQQ